MKRKFTRILCLVLCLALLPIFLFSCKAGPIYSLGPYEITESQYKYLAGMFNRQVLESVGLFGYSYDAVDESSGMSIGEALDKNYSTDFTASVISLLYSQLLFDKYELTLDEATIKLIDSNVATIVQYYGGGSSQKFDLVSEKYGYTSADLKAVYTMQMKQRAVADYLFGVNGEKIDNEELSKYYNANYMFFQTIVINNVYRVVTKEVDGVTKTEMIPLDENEVKVRNDIISDLNNLFISPVEGYVYKVIDPTKSYEELYALYSDDTAYPQGCYSKFPTVLTAQNAITAAYLLRENDVGKIVAKRPFTQDGTFTIDGEAVTVKAGDYLPYGYAFVKRMPLGEGAYDNEQYSDFFTTFRTDAKSKLFGIRMQEYILSEANFELEESDRISEIPLSSVMANNLDYNFFYGDLGKGKENS